MINTFIKAGIPILMLSLLMPALPKQYSEHEEVVVRISNLKNKKGKLMATLYNRAEGFPSSPEKAFKSEILDLSTSKAGVIRFSQIPTGTYAVSIFHDENNNDKLDTGNFGIPKEGYGFSNNPKVRFGPPSFKEAAFNTEKVGREIEIKLNY